MAVCALRSDTTVAWVLRSGGSVPVVCIAHSPSRSSSICHLGSSFYAGGLASLCRQSIAGLGAIFAVAIYRYGVEESSARRIKALFSSYVSAKIVDELVRNPHLARVGGHRREVSVVFADIVGFSTYAERVSPEQVVDMLNEVLREMSEVILRWDGCLNKFVGDCIVAFWNAPVEQPDHAVLAARCVMNMEKRMGELQAKWRAEGKPPIDIGKGVNTGEVLVGNIGIEGKKMDYTVIGDHVNLAARVEHLTREYGNRVLITEYTHRKIFGDADHGLGHIAATLCRSCSREGA